MRKISTIYWAISAGVSIAFIIFSFLTPNEFISTIFVLFIPIILIPNYFIRSHVKKISDKIEAVYFSECDPFRYLEQMEENNRKYIKTAQSKFYFKIKRADFLCECGNFKEAREILDELLEHESDFNNALLSYYYKVWVSYFFEFGNFDNAGVILEQMQKIACQPSNRATMMFSKSLYFSCLSKYNVLTKRDLANTEKYFAAMVNSNAAKAHMVSGMYYLTLIAIEKKEYEKARRRSKYVKENGNKMSYTKKIKTVIDYLNSVDPKIDKSPEIM